MSDKLAGKAAMVTGAAMGIGKAICLKLAEMGANVGGVDIAEEPLEQLRKLVEAKGTKFLAVKADVRDFGQMGKAVSTVTEAFGSLDVLVNNAGITRDNLLIRMDEAEWQDVMSINLTGVFNGLKAAARVMMRQKAGSIINISSVVGMIGNVGQCNYAASKAGVIGLTKAAARELARRNVRVNAIAPGYIVTKMTEKLGEEARTALLQQIPLQRMGQPEDVANLVAFLASHESSYITGQVIRVDGGMVM